MATALPVAHYTPGTSPAVKLNTVAVGSRVSITVQNIGSVDIYIDYIKPPTSSSGVVYAPANGNAVLTDFTQSDIYAIAVSGTAALAVYEVKNP